MATSKKLNFAPLRKVMDKIDDNGRHGRCGNWEMGLGGYDMGYEIYYRGAPIGRVNYGDKEYELYDDFIPEEQIPEFLDAIDARRFKDVSHHEVDDEDFNYEDQTMIDESRKQTMWAVDVRNMNTALHGLFYGPDKRQVQQFAKALNAIFSDYERGGLDDDGLQYAWEDLVVQFPDMAQMEEVNFRDFGPTSSGWKKGLEDDDFEYRIINSPAIDIYSESKRNQKMKFKKIVSEADDGDDYVSDHPRIYVGTYAKYNDGSIDGKWIDLTKYSTYEDFVQACHELHADEEDPEFMVQDYENFPERWYHEGGLPTEEEFNQINNYYLMDDSVKPAYEEYIDLGLGDEDEESFYEHYIGEFSDPDEFGQYAVENWGMPEDVDYYFDYDSFGRDLTMDWHVGDPDNEDAEGEPEDSDYYYDNDGYQQAPYDSDQEVAEQWVDEMGGVSQLGKDTIDNYFDYEAYGRDILINDCTESNGYVFWNH